MPPERYVQLVRQELRQRHHGFADRRLRSVYFGGGTPSLIPARLIVSIISELATLGFKIDESTEVTIEINPATLQEENLELYLSAGINRFSVGAQTFDDVLLKTCGREHSAAQTRETLDLLARYKLNYSFDLLFALPGQSRAGLAKDLAEVEQYQPKHLSAYCLTVPTGHPMSTGRAPESEQIEMFHLIEEKLSDFGVQKYEISNFSEPGFESRHNLAYWTNLPFWGLGLSAHSYLPSPNYGVRFWNPKSFDLYEQQLIDAEALDAPYSKLPAEQVEHLALHESLTDICHMHLRTRSGLPLAILERLFPSVHQQFVLPRLDQLESRGLLRRTTAGWALTPEGELLSNLVFSDLTFSSKEMR